MARVHETATALILYRCMPRIPHHLGRDRLDPARNGASARSGKLRNRTAENADGRGKKISAFSPSCRG
jgi:hypothetical protein